MQPSIVEPQREEIMAKISAHGECVGTIDYVRKSKRYMSDGVVLKNIGHGWKLAGKLKPGLTPQDAYERARVAYDGELARRPALAAYRRAIHDACGLSKRWKLVSAIELMPDDADGVWSEACDSYGDNVHLDINEVSELCRLYSAAVAESKAMSDAPN
jgi:hypothetical protein